MSMVSQVRCFDLSRVGDKLLGSVLGLEMFGDNGSNVSVNLRFDILQ